MKTARLMKITGILRNGMQCLLLLILVLSGVARAQEPERTEVRGLTVHDLGDLMSVQSRIERPSLVVVTEELDSQSLLEKLQAEAWQDLENEALRPIPSAKELGR